MRATLDAVRRPPDAGLMARFMSWVDHRLNPFFVKDIRSWLRSKKFLAIFFVALASCMVVTIMIIVDGESGRTLFSVLVTGLAMVLVGVVPYLMQDKFADELASGSTELAMISRMTPGRMVRGKILSGLVANLLFFSALGPSVLIAYMLGGVHPFIMAYILMSVSALSALSMILAIVVVTIVGRRPVKVLSLALFGVGFGAAAMMAGISEESNTHRMFASDEFWYVNLLLGGEALLGGLFLYSVSVSRLSFASANRDLLPRLTLSIWTLLHLLIGFGAVLIREHVFQETGDADDISEIAIVLATLAFTAGFFLLNGTAEGLSRRLLKTGHSRMSAWFLLPGQGRLYFYVMVHFGVLTIAAMYYFFNVRHGRNGITFVAFVFAAYYLISGTYLGYRLVDRYIFKQQHPPVTMSMAIIAAIWMVWGTLLSAIFGRDAELLLVSSPASAFYWVAEEKQAHVLATIVALTSPCWATASILWIRAFIRRNNTPQPDGQPVETTPDSTSGGDD